MNMFTAAATELPSSDILRCQTPANPGADRARAIDITDGDLTRLKAPAASLGAKVNAAIIELLPPDALTGLLAEEYRKVLDSTKGLLESSENRWMLEKQSAAREDIVTGDCLMRLEKFLREARSKAGAGNSLISRASREVAAAIAESSEKLRDIDRALSSRPENVKAKVSRIAVVEGFSRSAMRPLEWFEEMRGSLPSELRADIQKALSDFGQPAGLLYRLGIKNADKEKERICTGLLKRWVDGERAAIKGNDSELETLQRDRETAVKNTKTLEAKSLLRYMWNLETLTEDCVRSTVTMPRLAAIQVLGKEYGELKLEATMIRDSLNEALSVLDAIDLAGDRITEPHGQFCKAAGLTLAQKSVHDGFQDAIKKIESQMARCDSATELNKLTVKLREHKENLQRHTESIQQGENDLKAAIQTFGRALFREAKSQVLSSQDVSREAVSMGRDLCEALMPHISGANYRESAATVLGANEKALRTLRTACHASISRWMEEDAESLLRDHISEVCGKARKRVSWSDLSRHEHRPVILDMEELEKRTRAGRNSILFTASFQGYVNGYAWPVGSGKRMTGRGNIPNAILFPLLEIESNGSFSYGTRGTAEGRFWLPLGESINKDDMSAAMRGFLEHCETGDEQLTAKIDFEFKP